MKIFDTMILDAILISLPLTIYLLYLAYTKTFNNKENNLLIVVTIFSVLYLLFKYTTPLYLNMPFMIINIPLIIAYLKNSKSSIIITSTIMVIYYYNFYQGFLFIIVLEYILYYLFVKIKSKIGLLPIGKSSLATARVAGKNLVPLPAIKMTHCSTFCFILASIFSISSSFCLSTIS